MVPRVLPAMCAGAAHALLVAFFIHTYGWEGILGVHDGRHFATLLHDPLLLGDASVDLDWPTFRALRIAMPLLAFPFRAAGSLYALGVVQVGSVTLGTWAMAGLLARRGRSTWWGMVFALVPGVLIATRVLVATALATATGLAAIDARERDRSVEMAAWAGVAMLTRETMTLVIIALAVISLRKGDVRAIRRLAVPMAIWTAWIAFLVIRFGWGMPDSTVGLPFVGFVRAVEIWIPNGAWFELVSGASGLAITGVLWALTVRRADAVALVGVFASSVIPFLGVEAWRDIVNAQRFVSLPTACLVVVLLKNTDSAQSV